MDALMAVLPELCGFLRYIIRAIETRPATNDDRPGDAMSNGDWSATGIDMRRRRPERFDVPDDFMTENRRRRLRPPAGKCMEVAATERTARNADKDLRAGR